MTDELNGQQENAVVDAPATESETPPVTDVPTEAVEDEPEKLVPQSKVNEIIGAAKKEASTKAYDKAMRDFSAPPAIEQPVVEPQQNTNSEPEPDVEKAKFEQRFTQEVNRRVADARVADELQKFSNVIESGKNKYEDFDESVRELNFVDNADLIPFANQVDNGADVLYELSKNPTKFANVLTLSRVNPALAQRQFTELSKSIKSNQEAMQQKTAAEPLDQIKPSNTGTDNGLNTVRDLRNLPSLRG